MGRALKTRATEEADLATLWRLEVAFWKADVAFHAQHLADDCLMALPSAGLLDRARVVASVGAAPRWTELEITDRHALALEGDCMLLSYRATARRPGADAPYRTLASSVYRRRDDAWELVFHQQTPAGTPS